MKHDDLHLILRDHLALDRTRLANRRTMLAYLRTALMLLVSGATLVKVFHSEMVMIILGITLLPISFVVAVMGLTSYLMAKHRMKNLYNLPDRME